MPCALRRPHQRRTWSIWRRLAESWESLAPTPKVSTAQCAETTEQRTITSIPPQLRSAGVVVVGPGEVPAAKAGIGHARPTAAGARAPLKSTPLRGQQSKEVLYSTSLITIVIIMHKFCYLRRVRAHSAPSFKSSLTGVTYGF